MWKEFKGFIASDNIITMATGIIMGSAFTAIVKSLVDDVFMPIIVAITGQADVTDLAISIGNAKLSVGLFLQAVINFFLIAIFLYATLKFLERVQNKKIVAPEEEKPDGPSESELLEEILNELRKK